MDTQFSELVTFCETPCELRGSLENMKPHLGYFIREGIRIVEKQGGPSTATIAPYIGRGLLEASLTALLFRLDPFRGLTLIRFQTDADFDHNSPQNISINWSVDLMSDAPESATIWKPKQKPEDVSRGLLSPYRDHVVWRPAVLAAKDFLDSKPPLSYPTKLAGDPDIFVKSIRGEARQLYSFWSKGIHGEFFAIGPHTLDEITCSDKVRRTIDLVLDLAFVSHFTVASLGNAEADRAFNMFHGAKVTLNGG